MDNLIVDALATQRLTRLVVEDAITEPIRNFIFKKFGEPEDNRISYLITCPHCASMWIGFGVVAARTIAPKAWRPLSYALAFSSVTGWIEEHS
jgi:hypothetical protein